MRRPTISLLFVALLVGSMSLVYFRYESRLVYVELHDLERQRDDLDIEYGRLLLERATWSMSDLVEREAGERLSMYRPAPDSITTLLVSEDSSR